MRGGREREILIYKIVCLPVIAKVSPAREELFSVCKSPAECPSENMPVGRGGAIFFSLWQLRLPAKGTGWVVVKLLLRSRNFKTVENGTLSDEFPTL